MDGQYRFKLLYLELFLRMDKVEGYAVSVTRVQLPTGKDANSHDVYFFYVCLLANFPSPKSAWGFVICGCELSYNVRILLVDQRPPRQALGCATMCTFSRLLGQFDITIIINIRLCLITANHMITCGYKNGVPR
jgi:hypothetical protein